MHLVTVRIDGTTRAGRVSGDEVVLLDAPDVRAVLEAGFVGDGHLGVAEAGGSVALEDADLAPVIPAPDKIVCVGANYMDHILETGKQPPPHPIYFAKYRGALTGPRDPICLPAPEVSVNADWEAELAVIIGKPVRNVTEGEAPGAIAGCAVLNDLSVRDWQQRTSQHLAGKTFERSTPLGPALVTADEVGDGTGLGISCSVDGVEKQSSNTSQLVFKPAKLISDLSTIITLLPGDVIATGTPGGVGLARDPQEWLTPGAVVRTAIEGIGELVNTCVVG